MLEIKTKTPIPLYNPVQTSRSNIADILGISINDVVTNVDFEQDGYGYIKAGNGELTFTQDYSGIVIKVKDISGEYYTPKTGETIPVAIIAGLTVVDNS